MGGDDKPNIFIHQTLEIFLSIVLASATAHVLQIFATINDLNASSWFIFTIIIVIGIFILIIYIFNKPSSEKYAKLITFFKAILIFIVTVTLFAIGRFASFYYNEDIHILNVQDMFVWVWGLVLGCGIFLSLCTIFEYLGNTKNYKYIALAIIAAILILLALCMLIFGINFLQLRGITE